MSKSKSTICQNCSTESESTFKFCPNCGQKNTDGRIVFSEIWTEFQDAVFNIESRTWRTVKNLFIPGKLTTEYFLGKHRRYVHPLRLLIVTSILAVIAMNFQDFQSATNHQYDINERIVRNYERQRLFGILGKITDHTKTIYSDQQTLAVTDTILTSFEDSLKVMLREYGNTHGDGYGNSVDLTYYVGSPDDKREKISKRDFVNMSEEELVEKYKKDASTLDQFFFKQRIKFVKDESQLFAAIVGRTTWAFLLMMPCLALVLYFLYFRNNYFYIEHLIFTFHLQSFAFILLTTILLGMYVFPWWIISSLLVVIWIYLFLSMRKVYGQSIGKTLLKFLLLSISYLVLFVLIVIGTILFSFMLM